MDTHGHETAPSPLLIGLRRLSRPYVSIEDMDAQALVESSTEAKKTLSEMRRGHALPGEAALAS